VFAPRPHAIAPQRSTALEGGGALSLRLLLPVNEECGKSLAHHIGRRPLLGESDHAKRRVLLCVDRGEDSHGSIASSFLEPLRFHHRLLAGRTEIETLSTTAGGAERAVTRALQSP